MKKTLIVVVSLLVIVGVLAYIFPALVHKPYYLVKHSKTEYPLTYLTPTGRELSLKSFATAKEYSFKDILFKLPFGNLTKENKSSEGNIIRMDFDNKTVLISQEADLYGMMFKDVSNKEQQLFFDNVASKYGIKSNYNYYKAVAEATPTDMKLFGNKTDFITVNTTLLMKPIIFLNRQSKTFYSYETSEIKAFQSGTTGQDNVAVVVFDKQDNVYTFGFNKSVSQDEIDFIIASVYRGNQIIQVSGSNMLPTLKKGDSIQVSNNNSDFKRSDIIVFKYPKDQNQLFIQRIVGLPGEQIEIKNGKFYINGSQLDESKYLSSDVLTYGKAGIITLGTSEYFVAGDNRTASSDSRVWGALDSKLIVGKMLSKAVK